MKLQNFLIGFLVLPLGGCFFLEINKTPRKTAYDSIKVDENTSVRQEDEIYIAIPLTRIQRRVSLDLIHRLPSIEDEAAVKDISDISQLVDYFFEGQKVSKALAQKHRFMWQLNQAVSTDFNRFALTDKKFLKLLTPENLFTLYSEPVNSLQYLLEDQYQFKDLFYRNWIVAKDDRWKFYSTQKFEVLWPEDGVDIYENKDIFKNLGIFASHAVMASLGSENQPIAYGRTVRFFKQFLCQDFQVDDAHRFSKISFTKTLREQSEESKECAACHKIYHPVARAFENFHTDDILKNWLTPKKVSKFSGNYNGEAFTSLESLTKLISQDQKTQSCELVNLFEYVLQRPYNSDSDSKIFYEILDDFQKNEQNLIQAFQKILASELYVNTFQSFSLADKKTSFYSEVRFLNYEQLNEISKQLLQGISIAIPFDLFVSQNTTENSYFLPNSIYFRSFLEFGKTLSSKIVEEELTSKLNQNSRYVFSLLPTDINVTILDKTVNDQIIRIWFLFTGYNIGLKDSVFSELKDLYTESKSEKSTNEKAWANVLLAILMSPEFMTY